MQLCYIPKRLFEFRNVTPALKVWTQKLLEAVKTRFYSVEMF